MKVTIVLAAILFTLSGGMISAHAADENNNNNGNGEQADHGRIGPYISVGAAFDWRNSEAGGTTPGLNSRLGFRFWQYMSAEVEYELQGKGPRGYTIGGNLKAHPAGGSIQPFFLLGGTYWDLDSERESGPGVRLGGGVDGYITEQIYLTAGIEYVWGVGDMDPYNFATAYIGAGFRL